MLDAGACSRRVRTKLWTLLLCLGAALMLVAAHTVPASAHGMDLIRADDNIHSYASDEATFKDWSYWNHAIHFTQVNEYDARTDVRVVNQWKSPTSRTNVIWWATSTAALEGAAGDYRCVAKDLWPTVRCKRGNMRVDQAYTRPYPAAPDAASWEIACHELGHSYGFSHLPNFDYAVGCMAPALNPSRPGVGKISSHMVYKLNYAY